jgi:hypothetical protein
MKTEKYRILFQGLIDTSWSLYFAGMTVTAEPAGVTCLTGEVVDQSALHGLLNKIRDLNLKVISIQLLDSDGVIPVECRNCPQNKPVQNRNKPSNTSLDG